MVPLLSFMTSFVNVPFRMVPLLVTLPWNSVLPAAPSLPVIVPLQSLDREALKRILTEPKNALVKQYQKLFQMDNVKLDFEQDAIEAIADKALERKTGARGLRSIMESVMMDTMYEIPSDDTIEECVVTKAAVDGESEPLTLHEDSLKKAK